MGVPAFEIKSLIEDNGVAVYSSNYTLYGDMSAWVMNTLARHTPQIEVYSIDEAFLNLQGMNWDLEAYGRGIHYRIRRNTGIPVGVGIVPTKVLAKAANSFNQTPIADAGDDQMVECSGPGGQTIFLDTSSSRDPSMLHLL